MSRSEALNQARVYLSQALIQEELMLQEAAYIDWLVQGERNSAYFHAIIKERTARPIFKLQREDGSLSEDNSVIGQPAVTYFDNLLSSTTVQDSTDLLNVLSSEVSKEEIAALIKLPDVNEIEGVVFELHPGKAPGKDGFTSYFYQFSWHIICTDVCDAVLDFFRGGSMLKPVASAVLVLIPKLETPDLFKS